MNATTYFFLGLAVGIVAMLLVAWLRAVRLRNIFNEKEKYFNDKIAALDKLKLTSEIALQKTREDLLKTEQLLEKQREMTSLQTFSVATLENENKNLFEKLSTQKKEIEELQKRLTTEFENIANKILKERASEFTQANEKNISEILNPLKERISSFEKKVEETYDKELRDKLSLREEVKRLAELNSRVSEDANNLTRALKGDVKKQGNWGEIVLERVLERSGLSQGQEYEREQIIEGGDKNIQRPDVIIHLPDKKHIIIDSKVSLVAYDSYVNAQNDDERDNYLKNHIRSLREHVKLLNEKKYQAAPELNTPDFVLMFVPIEASFAVAVQSDPGLFSFAWDKKIVIVCPTTLLATLRTISSIWRQENQTRYAREIAQLSGRLYDKLAGFVEDLTRIKENIDRAGNAYDDAMRKMQTGNGNIFRTAGKIKKLGAIVTKTLPDLDMTKEMEE